MTFRKFLLHVAVLLATLLWLIVAVMGGPVRAHEWYPLSCCSDKDCFAIPASEVEATSDGWHIKATGEVIPYDRTRNTPPEGNGEFHRCSRQGKPDGLTIGANRTTDACLWAPVMSF
jgi:hypothetical protein